MWPVIRLTMNIKGGITLARKDYPVMMLNRVNEIKPDMFACDAVQ